MMFFAAEAPPMARIRSISRSTRWDGHLPWGQRRRCRVIWLLRSAAGLGLLAQQKSIRMDERTNHASHPTGIQVGW